MLLLAFTGGGVEQASAVTETSPATDSDGDDPTHRGSLELVRYADSDRAELSVEVAAALVKASGGTSEYVVLVAEEAWSDAAVTGPLAASLDAPVILVPPDGLQTPAARPEFVELLRSAGVRRAVLVGDPAGLPNHEPSVLFGQGLLPRNIERIHGDDPVGTAVAVAERIGTPAELAELGRTVIVASDRSVADAVAVGPLAAAGPFPLLLSPPGALDRRISAYLTAQEIEHVVLVGGTAAIAPAVQEAIESADIAVTRLAGLDRIDTARLAGDLFVQHIAGSPTCIEGPSRLGLIPAQHPERGLTSGPLLAHRCAPLRLVNAGLPQTRLQNETYLARHRPGGVQLHAFGSASELPRELLEISLPPTRFAFARASVVPGRELVRTEVVIVDETQNPRHYPVTVALAPGAYPGTWEPRFSWSPDGTLLAYRSPFDELLILNVDSGELQQASLDDLVLSVVWPRPQWSPDGRKLAFSALIDDPSTVTEIYLWETVHEHTSELFVYDVETRVTTRQTHNTVSDFAGPWSPDGSRIAVTDREPVSVGYGGWYSPFYNTLRVRSHHAASKTDTELRCCVSRDPHLAWSASGRYLAFDGIDGDPRFNGQDVFVADVDMSSIHQVTPYGCSTPKPEDEGYPDACWSGHRGWSKFGDLLLVNDEGVDLVFDAVSRSSTEILDNVSPQHGYAILPNWSDQKGRLRVWAGPPPDGGLRLATARLDGSDVRAIATVAVKTAERRAGNGHPPEFRSDFGHLAVSPDERHVAVMYLQHGLELNQSDGSNPITLIDYDDPLNGEYSLWDAASRTDRERKWECFGEWTEFGIRGSCASDGYIWQAPR